MQALQTFDEARGPSHAAADGAWQHWVRDAHLAPSGLQVGGGGGTGAGVRVGARVGDRAGARVGDRVGAPVVGARVVERPSPLMVQSSSMLAAASNDSTATYTLVKGAGASPVSHSSMVPSVADQQSLSTL